MGFPSKRLRILIACSIGVIIPVFQFLSQRQHHLRLQKHGVITKAVSAYRQSPGSSYVDFSFNTPQGKTIQKSQKCGDKETFDRLYSIMLVIYNPSDPNEFDTFYDYENYSLRYSIFFLLIIYPIFLIIFVLIVFRVFKGLYLFYANRNRSPTI
jgi:hypothetical protein